MSYDRIRKVIAIGAVAVGGGLITALPAEAARHNSRHRPAHHSRPTSAIPQHNGGDRDADNNGAASDGDGNI
jgi:hypothetical protein